MFFKGLYDIATKQHGLPPHKKSHESNTDFYLFFAFMALDKYFLYLTLVFIKNKKTSCFFIVIVNLFI